MKIKYKIDGHTLFVKNSFFWKEVPMPAGLADKYIISEHRPWRTLELIKNGILNWDGTITLDLNLNLNLNLNQEK